MLLSYTSSSSPPASLVEDPQLPLWLEGFGFWACGQNLGPFRCDLCCAYGQTLPAWWRCSHSSCSPPLGPSSLHCVGVGPLAIAQGMCGDAEQDCV